jgi:hypothetical protein
MKLINIKTHIEGEPYVSNVLLAFGKNLRPAYKPYGKDVYSSEVIGIQDDGWYIRIESPFSKVVTQMDPHDFTVKTGPHRRIWLFRRRPSIKNIIKSWAWLPVDE